MSDTHSERERALVAIRRLVGWFRESALPLWLDAGFDESTGSFWEHLDFEAKPILGVPRRLTVQGRQIFTYARATKLGWIDGRAKAGRALDAMVERYRKPETGPGFVFTVDDAGNAIDSRRDFYAHAFVLLAAAGWHELTGDAQAIALADETLAFLDEHLTEPNGGYRDAWPNAPSRLRQNPHMHLFEALMALHSAIGQSRFLARAGEIYGYYRTRFHRPELGVLAEFFEPDWSPEEGARAVWEPGHHLEWSWLLSEYSRLTGVPTALDADRLVERAYAQAIFPPCRIIEEIRADGTGIKAGCRSWPLTEAIKAHVVQLERGGEMAADRLATAADWLVERHLTGCKPGLWLDQFTADDRLVPNYVPASTLYHIAMAVFVANEI